MLLSLQFRRAINRDPEATVPNMFQTKDFTELPIYVTEIFDPAHFWCHIAYSNEVKEVKLNFDIFQKEINSTYKKLKKQELHFSKENLKPGLIVAAYFSDFKSWYRVKVLEYDAGSDVAKVFCIDYGTKGALNRRRLRYLFQDLMEYPRYAFRGRLHGVKPSLGRRYFRPVDVEQFIAAISARTFSATCERFDETDNAFEMSLIRSSDGLDMKSFLMAREMAADIEPEEYDAKVCLGPVCYLLPTFEMLESTYPRYVDLYELEAEEANFNAVVDTNFFHTITPENVDERSELAMTLKRRQYRRSYKYLFGSSP
jgi:hypothetical protein